MFGWLRTFIKQDPAPPVWESEPLPEGKLYRVPCGNCGEVLFYYTHTLRYGTIPIYQHALDLKGIPYDRVYKHESCRMATLPVIEACEIVDNPFIKKPKKRKTK